MAQAPGVHLLLALLGVREVEGREEGRRSLQCVAIGGVVVAAAAAVGRTDRVFLNNNFCCGGGRSGEGGDCSENTSLSRDELVVWC